MRCIALVACVACAAPAAAEVRFALGAGAMVVPSQARAPAGVVAVNPAVNLGFGLLDVRIALQVLGYFTSFNAGFAAVDAQLRLNLAPWLAVGAGPYVGIASSPEIDAAVGFSFSPVVIKLGPRGQHELSVWLAAPFVFSNPTLWLALVGYTHVF